MAFNLKVVQNCPVTRASQGRVTMPQWLLAELVGTLEREKGQEWLILLHGERSKDGLEVTVESASVPADQRRSPAAVHLSERVWPDEDRVIGTLHSHHSLSLGATFSGTDDKDLATKFPFTMVISEHLHTDEHHWLGFSYKAESKVMLPCGTLGTVDFKLVPEGVEDWPIKAESTFDEEEGGPLGDCANLQQGSSHLGAYYVNIQAKCGKGEVRSDPFYQIFGVGEGEMASLLPPPITYPVVKGGWRGHESVVQAYIDAEVEVDPEYQEMGYSAGGIECECCGAKKGHYLLIGKDIICKGCEDFWRSEDTGERPTLSNDSWIKDWDEDRAWQERWAEVYERGGC